MKTVALTIRKCPASLHAELRRRARREQRSLNSAVLALLETHASERLPERDLMKQLKALPDSGVRLTLKETREAIREGRR